MSSKIYNIFGKEESISLFKTQELKSDNIYVYYYQNSISSFVFFIPAIYLNLYSESFIDIYISIQLHLMGIISFLWWACQRKYIHYFDIILYSNLISISGLYLLNNHNIISEPLFFYYNFNFILLILKIYLSIMTEDNILEGYDSPEMRISKKDPDRNEKTTVKCDCPVCWEGSIPLIRYHGWYSEKQRKANKKIFYYTNNEGKEVIVTEAKSNDDIWSSFDDAKYMGIVKHFIRNINLNIYNAKKSE